MNRVALLVLAIPALATAGQKSPAVRYQSFKQGRVIYHTVVCDVSSRAISVKTMFSPRLASVWDFIGREQPIVALTGTFFDPKSHLPVADVLVDGNLRSFGSRGSGFGVDYRGGVQIFDERYRQSMDWASYQFGMRGAIRVVNAGNVVPNPKAQRFRDASLWGRASRTGLGLTKAGKLVIVATSGKVTLSELGKAMVSRGVRSGIALDGGSSTCLYYNGALVVPPGRKLSTMLVISRRDWVAMR